MSERTRGDLQLLLTGAEMELESANSLVEALRSVIDNFPKDLEEQIMRLKERRDEYRAEPQSDRCFGAELASNSAIQKMEMLFRKYISIAKAQRKDQTDEGSINRH